MNQTQKHTTGKKLLALLLALIMSVSLLPMSVFAAEMDGQTDAVDPTVVGQGVEDAALDESSSEEEIVDSQEPVEDVQEPAEDETDVTDADTQAAEGDVAVQADDSIYTQVEEGKAKSLPAPAKNKMDYRIVHIDCGRKYFSADDLKKIIDYAYEYGYTHVELAFGNDGLRFLLKDMSVGTYTSDQVSAAIQAGNDAFDNAARNSNLASKTEELNETDMNEIIAYANGKGIGIIPMFDAPGHLYAVITAMRSLGLTVTSSNPSNSGSSPNWAINPTDTASISFVQTLMQKYITYFAGKGCTMFNIAADECGFSNMNNNTYTAYAKLVNSMAAMVQNAGMVALAFNDGIYHKNLTTSVKFDTNIAVCYWDASTDKYASAATLADEGFKIINTNNKWYYVIGKENITNRNDWSGYAYTCQYAKEQMSSENSCLSIDGDNNQTTPAGCMAAIWCDYPANNVNLKNVESYIQTLANAKGNSDYFKTPETPKEPVLTADKKTVAVNDTVKFTLENYTGDAKIDWSSSDSKVLALSEITRDNTIEATALTEGSAIVTANVEDKSYSASVTVTAQQLEERTITVTVGGTATDVIENANYEGTYETEDPSIATVASAKYEKVDGEKKFTAATSVSSENSYHIKNDAGKYLNASGKWVDDTANAAKWTVTSTSYQGYYFLKCGSAYLSYSNNAYTTTTSSSGAYYFTVSGSVLSGYWNSTTLGTAGTLTTTEPKDGTTITFKGVTEGTTYVTIGNVKYTINVVTEKLDGITLPIQTWITNYAIETGSTTSENYWAASWSAGTNNQKAYYVNIAAADVYGPEGKSISDCMPNNLKRYENGGTYWIDEKTDKTVKELVVWSGRVHSSSNVQKLYGKDYSNTGTEFNYVRYYGGKWEVSATGLADSWVEVKGTNTQSTEQIAVYYMIRSTITQEITTDVADWGAQKGETAYTDQVSSSNTETFVLLDFAVKYEDNSQNPEKFPVDKKTFAFHCKTSDSGGAVHQKGNYYYRDLNNFRAVNTSDYEVYMVTVTMTSDDAGTTLTSNEATNSYTYGGEEQVLWAIDQETRNKFTLEDYTSISGSETYTGCKIGGDPYIRGVEVYRQHGALITYYVRAKTTVTDALTVHYLDRSADDYEFYFYPIVVSESTVFDANFAQAEENSTTLIGNTVKNSLGVEQTVTAELKDIPAIGAQYRYSNYTCVEVKRSDDGKHVYLYYTFNAEKTFVVDFGLPLTITTADINSNLDAVNKANRLTRIVTNNSNYADVKTTNDYSIIYTLNKTIDGKDNITATYFGKNAEGTENNVTYTLSIIPASTVYYEDSFATFYDAGSSAAKTSFDKTGGTDTMGTWYVDGDELTSMPNQALEELGKKNNVYGYDPAYTQGNNSTTFSMGSAKKVTVNADVTTNPTAQFTFKGTGFDVISLTDNRSGMIFIEVTNVETGAIVKRGAVNNYYGYTQDENGDWVVKTDGNGCLYQIPVAKVADLDYAEYKVTIKVSYSSSFDHTNNNAYSFWLDAIRVYDPMGKNASGTYTNDGEAYPQFIELRDELKNSNSTAEIAGEKKVVFIDGAKEAKLDDYKNYGPNNEVYLANGQAITFHVPSDQVVSVQIGAKAPQGNALLTVNGATLDSKKTNGTISTATEMYYELVGAAGEIVTITNKGDGILSLTNLKITFTAAQDTVTLAALSDEDQANAVAAVRALFAAPVEPEPDPEPETFEPERFEVSWNRSTVKVGQKATLTVKTSEDVEAITVDGETVTSYRTRTQRTGWGWNAKRVTYREFTYTVTAAEAGTLTVSVAAVNAENVSSAAVTATVTVQAASQRPGIGGWLDNIFGRWF